MSEYKLYAFAQIIKELKTVNIRTCRNMSPALRKVKVKLSLCFNQLSTMPWRLVREWMYRSMYSWSLPLPGGKWSASSPGRFTPGERAPFTHWVGGWVGPRAGLGDVERRKFLTLPRLELCENWNQIIRFVTAKYAHIYWSTQHDETLYH
jgi:hypothetical protein